jgi:hypothetical protein
MALQPSRSTVTIDGNKFDALEVRVAFETAKDRAGMPQMGSLRTTIQAVVDFHDDQNMPFGTLNHLFDLSNVVTRNKIVDMKIEYWKDDSRQDALVSYKFKGWISGFHTANPAGTDGGLATDGSVNLNHALILELEPALNQQNFPDVTLSN